MAHKNLHSRPLWRHSMKSKAHRAYECCAYLQKNQSIFLLKAYKLSVCVCVCIDMCKCVYELECLLNARQIK